MIRSEKSLEAEGNIQSVFGIPGWPKRMKQWLADKKAGKITQAQLQLLLAEDTMKNIAEADYNLLPIPPQPTGYDVYLKLKSSLLDEGKSFSDQQLKDFGKQFGGYWDALLEVNYTNQKNCEWFAMCEFRLREASNPLSEVARQKVLEFEEAGYKAIGVEMADKEHPYGLYFQETKNGI